MNFERVINRREQSISEQFDEKEQSLLGRFRERLGGKVGKGPLSALRLGTVVAWTFSQEPQSAHAAELYRETHAIVSRELGKPCIIGTQRATQVIKDGDMVEVRANHGTVRILN